MNLRPTNLQRVADLAWSDRLFKFSLRVRGHQGLGAMLHAFLLESRRSDMNVLSAMGQFSTWVLLRFAVHNATLTASI
jgi:hypothetical protein